MFGDICHNFFRTFHQSKLGSRSGPSQGKGFQFFKGQANLFFINWWFGEVIFQLFYCVAELRVQG